MNHEKIIERQQGDVELYRILHHLNYESSWDMKMAVYMAVGQEACSNAVDNCQTDVRQSMSRVIRIYLASNPSEYHPVFSIFYTPDELAKMRGEGRAA